MQMSLPRATINDGRISHRGAEKFGTQNALRCAAVLPAYAGGQWHCASCLQTTERVLLRAARACSCAGTVWQGAAQLESTMYAHATAVLCALRQRQHFVADTTTWCTQRSHCWARPGWLVRPVYAAKSGVQVGASSASTAEVQLLALAYCRPYPCRRQCKARPSHCAAPRLERRKSLQLTPGHRLIYMYVAGSARCLPL